MRRSREEEGDGGNRQSKRARQLATPWQLPVVREREENPLETRRRAYAPSGTDRDWSYARRRLGGKVLGRVSMDGWMDGWMWTGEEERIVGPVQFCDVATLAIIHKEN